jgi:hypothetical protein
MVATYEASVDSPDDVLSFYATKLEELGWTAADSSTAGSARYSKDAATITITASAVATDGQFVVAVDARATAAETAATATPTP